ncbi:MAG TPA: carboxypeptidase-like regulatory domain-containing protein [Candidatus Solibacter sp.]|nr:carboxypeptidase-like regulatory domain-containing protein [Candidatus Solibacter sp.]
MHADARRWNTKVLSACICVYLRPILFLSAGVVAAQPTPQPEQQLPERARLEGRVFNSITGEPLRKTKLTLRMNVAQQQNQTRQQRQEAPVTTYTVTSEAEGKYTFANIEPGDFQLTVTHDGYESLRLGDRSTRKSEPIAFAAGDRKADFNLKLIPYGTISGVLVDDEGDPIRNLPISAMRWRYTSNGRELFTVKKATSNDLGEYRIFDVPAGKYFVKIDPPRLVSEGPVLETNFPPVFYPGVLQVGGAVPQELTPGQQIRGVNFNLRRTKFAAIRGQVIAPAGSSPNCGLLIATDGGTNSTGGGTDGPDGKFVFPAVPPGPIYVTGGYTINGQRFDTMVQVDVGTSDINGLELRPVGPMDITGSVRIAGQTTIQPNQISLSLNGPSAGHNQTGSATIRENGSLLFHLISAGKYRLDLGRMRELYIKSIQWGMQDITDSGLDLLNGAPARTELAIVLGADAAQIEGIVSNEKSEPGDGATITLVPTGGRRSRTFHKSVVADNLGHFTIRGIAPGSYKLFAWDKVDTNAVIYDPDFLRPYEALGQAVEFGSSDKKVIELKVIANKEQ